MDLDDSKYILQLARVDLLSLPPTPGDWNVHVKRPDEDSASADNDHDMGAHQVGDGAGSSPGAAHFKAEDTDSQGHHTPGAEGSPRATTTPRVHQRDSPWAAQHAVPSPDRVRVQTAAAAARNPSSHRVQKYHRMALVSAIQPSFGTDASSMNQGDPARQAEYDGEEYGSERTTSGRGSQSS